MGDALVGLADGGELVPHAETISAAALIAAPSFDPAITDLLPDVTSTPDAITMQVSTPLVSRHLRLFVMLDTEQRGSAK
ncbi:MAG: hypothetical protein WCI78_09190 [Mycobacterium sp.]